MELYKRYIVVITEIDKQGNIKPLSIVWDNDTIYYVDKILKIQKSSRSVVGGGGQLFTCLIAGRSRKLFYEHYQDRFRWFIESTKP